MLRDKKFVRGDDGRELSLSCGSRDDSEGEQDEKPHQSLNQKEYTEKSQCGPCYRGCMQQTEMYGCLI
jgi:hypothetical protein